ncbi:MAG TPA: DUF4403 family protein [Acetobacteraceae bacterium]|nr:DUF4403 family protein [Acetobacteraceae bacterium]
MPRETGHNGKTDRKGLSRRRMIAFAATVPGVIGAGCGYDWIESQNVALTKPPVRSTSELKLPDCESVVSLCADIPLSLIRTAANRAIPAEYHFEGIGPDVGGTINLGGWNIIKFDVKVGTRYEGDVRKAGDLSVTGRDDKITVALPIAVSGNGGFRGDGARLLKLDAKNFRAGLILKVHVSIGLNTNWTPAITITPDLEWTDSPKVEIVHNVWIDIRSHVEGQMREQLSAMAQKIRESIPDDIVRRKAKQAWHAYSIPILGIAALPVWANIVPTSIGTSGVVVKDEEIRVGLMLKARTEISTDAGPNMTMLPLPALVRIPAMPGLLTIALPVRASYDCLRTAILEEIAHKPFAAGVVGGMATVIVNDVYLYPSDDRVVLGLAFRAQIPGRLFDASGKVFLTAKPATENGGMVVRMLDVTLARQLDNPIWDLASVILEGQITKSIEDKVRVNLTPQINKVILDLKTKLADPAITRSVRMTVRDVKVDVPEVIPEAGGLAALIRVDAGVDTELLSLPAKS